MTPIASPLRRHVEQLPATALLGKPVVWSAMWRVVAAMVLCVTASMFNATLLWASLLYAGLAAGHALDVQGRRNASRIAADTTMILAEAALASMFCAAAPEHPLLALLRPLFLMTWVLVVPVRAGLVASGVHTAAHVGTLAGLGTASGIIVGSSTLLGILMVAEVMLVGTVLRQLRLEWGRAREEERKRRAAQRRHLEQTGRLAGSVAHEMNNTLTAILGLASLMRDDADGALGDDLDALVMACRDGQRQIDNLLGMTGQGELNPEPVGAGALVRQAAQLLRRALPREVKVDLAVGRGLPDVVVDSVAMGRALLNVGLNASEAAKGGALTLRLAVSDVELAPGEDDELDHGRWVRIDVSDDGPGMDPEALKHVFDPMFTTKSQPEGTGLGLPYVHQVVQRHGGIVRIRSQQGSGTTATIWLPSEGPAAPVSDTSMPPRAILPMSRVVLLVEDDDIVRRALVRQLHHLKVDVLGAEGGVAALILAERHVERIDTVLMDLGLPDMEGDALLRDLRQLLPSAHIVVASGLLTDRDRLVLQEQGADAFLPKPFDRAQLSATLEGRS